MAVSRSLKNATFVFTDNDGVNSYTATLEQGNLTINVPNPAEHILDRGQPGVVIDGLHEDVTWTADFQMQSMTADPSLATVIDGSASGWTFTEADTSSGTYNGKSTGIQDVASAVNLVQVYVQIADPAGGSTETLYLLDNVIRANFAEGMPNIVSLSATCMGYSGANFWANVA